MTAPRILFRGHEDRGDHQLLIFSVVGDDRELTASVYVGKFGSVQFPHGQSDSGLSFGPATDAALLERAAQLVAMFRASDAWRAMHERRR